MRGVSSDERSIRAQFAASAPYASDERDQKIKLGFEDVEQRKAALLHEVEVECGDD